MEGWVGLREEPGHLLWPQGRRALRKGRSVAELITDCLTAPVFSAKPEREASARVQGGEEAGAGASRTEKL